MPYGAALDYATLLGGTEWTSKLLMVLHWMLTVRHCHRLHDLQ